MAGDEAEQAPPRAEDSGEGKGGQEEQRGEDQRAEGQQREEKEEQQQEEEEQQQEGEEHEQEEEEEEEIQLADPARRGVRRQQRSSNNDNNKSGNNNTPARVAATHESGRRRLRAINTSEELRNDELVVLVVVCTVTMLVAASMEGTPHGQHHLDQLLTKSKVFNMSLSEKNHIGVLRRHTHGVNEPYPPDHNTPSRAYLEFDPQTEQFLRTQQQQQQRQQQHQHQQLHSTPAAEMRGKRAQAAANAFTEPNFGCFESAGIRKLAGEVRAVLFDGKDREDAPPDAAVGSFAVGTHVVVADASNAPWLLVQEAACKCTNGKKCQFSLRADKAYAHESDLVVVVKGKGLAPIPRVLHLIWLGPHAMPFTAESWLTDFANAHPDFRVKVWRSSDLDALQLVNANAFARVDDWGGKADIARFGGMYVDADQMWLGRNVGEYWEKAEANHGILFAMERKPMITIGLILTAPRHPVLLRSNKIVFNSVETFESQASWFRTGPLVFTQAILGESTPLSQDATTLAVQLLQRTDDFDFASVGAFVPLDTLICNIWYDDWKAELKDRETREEEIQECKEAGKAIVYDYGYTTNRMWEKEH